MRRDVPETSRDDPNRSSRDTGMVVKMRAVDGGAGGAGVKPRGFGAHGLGSRPQAWGDTSQSIAMDRCSFALRGATRAEAKPARNGKWYCAQ